jgi:hypothetical protein
VVKRQKSEPLLNDKRAFGDERPGVPAWPHGPPKSGSDVSIPVDFI